MKKPVALLLIAALSLSVLSGCGSREEDPSEGRSSISEKIPEGDPYYKAPEKPASTEDEAGADEHEAPEDPGEDDSTPPSEGMIRSPLTHEWISGSLENQRPIAFMYPINIEAQPQYGLDNIDVFYEIMEEGDMSRQMAIMQDWKDIPKIGNVRSIRDYFVYTALEYDPIIVHYGGPELYVRTILTRDDVDNINGTGGILGEDYGAFFRENPNNVAQEHTAYTSGEKLLAAANAAGFSLTHRDKYFVPDHFVFASKAEPNTLKSYGSDAKNALELDFSEAYPTTKPTFTYNEKDHKYYRSIYGKPQCDAVSGNQLAFDNIIVQWTYYEVRDAKGYLAFRVHDLTHDGMLITRGKMLHITWQKTGDYEPTRYFDEAGNEIQLNQGRTMICVVQDDRSFLCNGRTVNPAAEYPNPAY